MAEAGLWLRPQLALPGDGHEQRGLVQLLLSELGRDCTLRAAGDAVVLRLPLTTPFTTSPVPFSTLAYTTSQPFLNALHVHTMNVLVQARRMPVPT